MGVYGHGQEVRELPFLDFAPDLAYDESMRKGVVLIGCDNAMPTVKGYQSLNSLEPYAEPGSIATGVPAPETVLGSTIAYFSDGQAKIYIGGPTQLWRLDGNSWTSVGSAGATTSARWRFAQWGDDVIAVNPGGGADGAPVTPHPPIIAPLVATGATGTFAPLGGGPPVNATTVVSVNGQVMMFSGADWYCSALDTDNDWTPDVTTQAGHGTLYDFPGAIVAAAPIYRNVVVFKETATWLLSYVGGYPVWSNQIISGLTGTWCQESVIIMPESIAFVGADDFYTCSGWAPQRIPNNLKEWWFDIADPTQFFVMLSRYDATHGTAYWYFVTKTAPIPTVPDRWIGWNSRNGRWGGGFMGESGAFSVPQPNQQPGVLTGLIITANRILQSWTGAPTTMRLETGYFGMPNGLSQAMRVRPIYYVEPESATLSPYHVRKLGWPDISGGTTFLNQTDGWYYFRQYDQWHRVVLNTVGPDIRPTVVSQTGAEVSAIAVDFRQGGWR